MNKLVKLFSVLALASTVAFVSCEGEKGEKGDIGPAGTAGQAGADGEDGADGNANILSFTHTVAVADWSEGGFPGISADTSIASVWGVVSVSNEAITDNKSVLAWLVNGTTNYALPITLSKEIDGSVEALQYGSSVGQVRLYYKKQTTLFGGTATYAPAADLNFKFVVIDETTPASMKSAGVELSDYNAVVNYLNQSVEVTTQL